MPQDEINITVLEDGTIKSETNKISPQNHSNASEFFKLLQSLSGGKSEAKRKQGHAHTHQHEEAGQ